MCKQLMLSVCSVHIPRPFCSEEEVNLERVDGLSH